MGDLVVAPRCSGVLPSPAVDERFVYTAEKHAEFDREGFLVAKHFLTPSALDFISERANEIIHHKAKDVHLEWIMSIHETLAPEENWVLELATHPSLLSMLRYHLGEDIVLFSTQLAVKPPGKGRIVPWHQDGERCRTVWIPLDNVSPASGGMRVQPGWHKLGRLPFKRVTSKSELARAEFFLKHHLFEVTAPQGSKLGLNAVAQRMPAGSLEIHHPGLPHASGPNRSRSWRRALLLRFQPLSEPLIGGTIVNWRDGSTFIKRNYLVCGQPPADLLRRPPSQHAEKETASGEQ